MAVRRAFEPSSIRTFALLGHRGAGKTSLGEAILQAAGVTRTVGRVDSGTSLLDHTDEERRRGVSLQPSYAWFEWGDSLLQLIDTPGIDLAATTRLRALSGADAAVVVVDGGQGFQHGTARGLADAARLGLPVAVVVNKLDRPCDLDGILRAVEAATGVRTVPLHLPFVDENGRFTGMIDVLERIAYRYWIPPGLDTRAATPLPVPRRARPGMTPEPVAEDDEPGPEEPGRFSPEPVPTVGVDALAMAWERLVDVVAGTDDDLLERYLEFFTLPPDDVRAALVTAVRNRKVIPVFLASATQAVGAAPLLDGLARVLPSAVERTTPVATDADGAQVPLPPEGPFVAQVLSVHRDEDDGQLAVLRIWSGAPPKSGVWVRGPAASLAEHRKAIRLAPAKVRKLYQIRGPRRATAQLVVAGALVATWDIPDAVPGETFGEHPLRMPAIEGAPIMAAWMVRPLTAHGQVAAPGSAEDRRLRDHVKRLCAIDPGLYPREEPTGLVLGGGSVAELELAVERLDAWWRVRVHTELPPVPYRETPASAATDVEGVHLVETDGLVAEFGACRLDVAPVDGLREEFSDGVDDDDDDALPPRYRPAITEGVRRAMAVGPSGYPVTGVAVRLVGGEYDILQSTDDHFRLAGEKAFRSALQRVGTRLLEPWWTVEASAGEEHVGDVINELSSHRGRILGLDVAEGNTTIQAAMPYRELRTFGQRLQAISAGRGRFVASPSHYEPVPEHLVPHVLAESNGGRRSAPAR